MKLKCPSPTCWIALAMLIVLPSVQANDEGKGNPYESIVERNPFSLKPPPPPAPPDTGPPAPPPPLATVELTGVTSIFSKKKALVEIVPGPGKPPMKLTLDEGERVDAIEVVSIDVDKAEVVINNAGSVTNISLKVAKATGAPGVPGVPGVPGLPGAMPPGLVPNPPNPINPAAHFNPNSSGKSAPMLTGGNATPAANPANPNAVPNYGIPNNYAQPNVGNPGGIYTSQGAGANTTPGLINRPIRTQVQNPNAPQAQGTDPAIQYINMAVQKQTMEAKGIQMPPLPPVLE